MALIKGEIETLKQLKRELNRYGFYQLDSLEKVEEFKRDYIVRRQEIISDVEREFENELVNLKKYSIKLKTSMHVKKNRVAEILLKHMASIDMRHYIIEPVDEDYFDKANRFLVGSYYFFKRSFIATNMNRIIQLRTIFLNKKLNTTEAKIEKFVHSREKIIGERLSPKTKALDQTQQIINRLYPKIAGAIGESRVVKEIKKLPDNYILFNDYSLKFRRPIYNRSEKDRIFSIQIDHLLVTNSGVFNIETKNWSAATLQNPEMRSPIDQIERTNFAMFILLNAPSGNSRVRIYNSKLPKRKIPIRNVVVMINNRLPEESGYAKILSLHELNSYVQWFDPIFSDAEVQKICEYLEHLKKVV